MDHGALRAKLQEMVARGERVMQTRTPPPAMVIGPDSVDSDAFGEWGVRVVALMRAAFGENDDFYRNAKKYTASNWDAGQAAQLLALVRGAIQCIDDGTVGDQTQETDPIEKVELLCERFNAVARQLRSRHADRETLSVKDEYDVQDLMHGLLRVFFDDVRSEEWTPSYAGSASRIDFLLSKEQIALETKMARKGLDGKKLGEELTIDIVKYAKHPDCKVLVCFAYDPEGLIRNPAAIERDLSKTHGSLVVRVLVRPRQ
jgi:hypothetical protein